MSGSANGQPGVLLDIDGTLLDATYHHGLAWLRAFRRLGHDTTAAQAHRAVGLGSDQLVPHLLGQEPGDVDADVAAALSDAHTEEYAELTAQVVALPGAAELVQRCARAGRRVVLVTSGKADDLDWQLPRIGPGVRELLHGSTTSDDVGATKPAPDLLATALAAHGLDPDRTVSVGDGVWDGQAAQRAGVRFVGLLSGGISEAELRESGAVEVYRDPAALVAAFDGSSLRVDD